MVHVIVVGCGRPKKSMGWKHAQNVLDGHIPHASLHTLVEPYLLRDGKETEGGVAFREWTSSQQVHAVSSIEECNFAGVPLTAVLAVIATRTADVWLYFDALLQLGVRAFYIEKPGATGTEAFTRLWEAADACNAQVTIGYARTGSKYYLQGLADFLARPGDVTFTHNNSYDCSTLDECFARNSEGMLKNMACHELAMAVAGFGLRRDAIMTLSVDLTKTVWETRGHVSDFRCLNFSLRTERHPSTEFVFHVDRCGGDWCGIEVNGAPLRMMPDADQIRMVERMAQEDPEIQRYFLLQDADYIRLLSAAVMAIESNAPLESVPTLADAGEVLRIAEFLTQHLHDFLHSHIVKSRAEDERMITIWTATPA